MASAPASMIVGAVPSSTAPRPSVPQPTHSTNPGSIFTPVGTVKVTAVNSAAAKSNFPAERARGIAMAYHLAERLLRLHPEIVVKRHDPDAPMSAKQIARTYLFQYNKTGLGVRAVHLALKLAQAIMPVEDWLACRQFLLPPVVSSGRNWEEEAKALLDTLYGELGFEPLLISLEMAKRNPNLIPRSSGAVRAMIYARGLHRQETP